MRYLYLQPKTDARGGNMVDWIMAPAHQLPLAPQGYEPAWEGEVAPESSLEDAAESVFRVHNEDGRPDGQLQRSMCVGDVVIIRNSSGKGPGKQREGAAFVVASVGVIRLSSLQACAVICGEPVPEWVAVARQAAI